jgi:hypothetical protein
LKDLTLDEHEVVKALLLLSSLFIKEEARKFKITLVDKPIFVKEQIITILWRLVVWGFYFAPTTRKKIINMTISFKKREKKKNKRLSQILNLVILLILCINS